MNDGEFSIEDFLTQLDKYPQFKTGRWVNSEESKILCDRVKTCEIYFESGTANGFSALNVALETSCIVHTFDPVNRPKIWESVNISKDVIEKICFHQDKFEMASPLIQSNTELHKSFFIDGDHGQGFVLRDFATIEPFLKSKDVIVFHDLRNNSVMKAWDQIRQSREFYSEEKIRTTRKMGILVV